MAQRLESAICQGSELAASLRADVVNSLSESQSLCDLYPTLLCLANGVIESLLEIESEIPAGAINHLRKVERSPKRIVELVDALDDALTTVGKLLALIEQRIALDPACYSAELYERLIEIAGEIPSYSDCMDELVWEVGRIEEWVGEHVDSLNDRPADARVRSPESLQNIAGEQYEKTESPIGVALHDAACFFDTDDAHFIVKRWIDSKKITANAIGKCPKDGRRLLYNLSELSENLKTVQGLDGRELLELKAHLKSRTRIPK